MVWGVGMGGTVWGEESTGEWSRGKQFGMTGPGLNCPG